MSQIVKIDSISIKNLELAKMVAKNNNYNYSEGGILSNFGYSKNVDHLFTNDSQSRLNFGLVKNEDNFNLVCDRDYLMEINNKFTSIYNLKALEREAELSGHNIESITETEDEIILNLN